MNRILSLSPVLLMLTGTVVVGCLLVLVLWWSRRRAQRQQLASDATHAWQRLALELGSIGLGTVPGNIARTTDQSRLVVNRLNALFERWRSLVETAERVMQRSRSSAAAVRGTLGELRKLSGQQRKAGLLGQQALARLLDMLASAREEHRALEHQAMDIERCCGAVATTLASQTEALLRVSELLGTGREHLQRVDRQVVLVRERLAELATEAQHIDLAVMNSRLLASRTGSEESRAHTQLAGEIGELARTLDLTARDVSLLTDSLGREVATIDKCLESIGSETRVAELAGLKGVQQIEAGILLGRNMADHVSAIAPRTERRADKVRAVIDIIEQTEQCRQRSMNVLDDSLATLGGLERLSDELDTCLATHRPAPGTESKSAAHKPLPSKELKPAVLN